MTRCNIVVNDSEDTLYLYHHCDGYPKGVGKELIDYLQTNTPKTADDVFKGLVFMYGDSYEETNGIHGDISYLYTIDIDNDLIKLRCENPDNDDVLFECTFNGGDSTDATLTKKDIENMQININIGYNTKKSDVYKNMPADMSVKEKMFLDMVIDDVVKHIRRKSSLDYITTNITINKEDYVSENKN